MRALRRLDSLGRFQLAAASVSVVLERASARVQCGRPREAARLLAACGLGDVPQLYAVLRDAIQQTFRTWGENLEQILGQVPGQALGQLEY